MRVIDASTLPRQFPDANVVGIDGFYKRRPGSIADDGKVARLAGVRVVNATDQCGVIFGAAHRFVTGGAWVCWSRVELEDFETDNFRRTTGNHVDHVRIEGSPDAARPLDVTLRNVHLSGSPLSTSSLNGGLLALHIEGGHFGDVVIDGYRLTDVAGQSAIDLKAGGSIRSLRVVNAPGVVIFVQGRDFRCPVYAGRDVTIKPSMGAHPDVIRADDGPAKVCGVVGSAYVPTVFPTTKARTKLARPPKRRTA